MPPKRAQSLTVKLSDFEMMRVKKLAQSWDMDASELGRCCIALALPILGDIEFVRRIRLEDNKNMNENQ